MYLIMIISINTPRYWKLLNIENLVFKEDCVDLSNCNIRKLNTNLSYSEAVKKLFNLFIYRYK